MAVVAPQGAIQLVTWGMIQTGDDLERHLDPHYCIKCKRQIESFRQ